jgi:hypothetical protein
MTAEVDTPVQALEIVGVGGDDLAGALSGLDVANVRVAGPQGWARAAGTVAAAGGPGGRRLRAVIASVSGELHDPSPDPSAGLASLAAAADHAGAPLLVLNGSTLVDDRDRAKARQIMDLDLVVLDGSKQTGLSVIDVDRLVAEIGGHGHIHGPCAYDEAVTGLVRDEITRVLGLRGVLQQTRAWRLVLPPLPQVSDLVLTEWLKQPGDAIADGDALCTVVVTGLRKLDRVTDARDLAAIVPKSGWWQQRRRRGRVRRKDVELAVTVKAWEGGVLRTMFVRSGHRFGPQSVLAVVTADAGTQVPDQAELAQAPGFRAYVEFGQPGADGVGDGDSGAGDTAGSGSGPGSGEGSKR